MTTLTQFTPSETAVPPFQFEITLDGTSYTVTTTWSLFRESWYLSLYTLDGVLVSTVPVVASPNGYDITLVPGFTDTLVFRGQTQNFESP